jgi:hypothetical protein
MPNTGGFCQPQAGLRNTAGDTAPQIKAITASQWRQPIRGVVYQRVLNRKRRRPQLFVVDNARAVVTLHISPTSLLDTLSAMYTGVEVRSLTECMTQYPR